MSLAVSCPHCHKAYTLAETLAGKRVRCRVCQAEIVVPPAVVPPPVVEKSGSGASVYRHQLPTAPPEIVVQGTPFLPQISKHIERTIGPAPMVFHEIISHTIHLDLHVVPPTNQPPSKAHPAGTYHHTVVTSGMSSKPMNVPKGNGGPRFMELMIALPPNWPGLRMDGTFDSAAMKDERHWWPMRWLKQVAQLPSEFNTFVGMNHTIPNGEEAAPFARNTRLGCMMVTPPFLSPQSAKLIINDHVTIYFLALMPLYPEEMQLKMSRGADALNDLLDNAGLQELIDIQRVNVAASLM